MAALYAALMFGQRCLPRGQAVSTPVSSSPRGLAPYFKTDAPAVSVWVLPDYHRAAPGRQQAAAKCGGQLAASRLARGRSDQARCAPGSVPRRGRRAALDRRAGRHGTLPSSSLTARCTPRWVGHDRLALYARVTAVRSPRTKGSRCAGTAIDRSWRADAATRPPDASPSCARPTSSRRSGTVRRNDGSQDRQRRPGTKTEDLKATLSAPATVARARMAGSTRSSDVGAPRQAHASDLRGRNDQRRALPYRQGKQEAFSN